MYDEEDKRLARRLGVAIVISGVLLVVTLADPMVAIAAWPIWVVSGAVFIFCGLAAIYLELLTKPIWALIITVVSAVLVASCPEFRGGVDTFAGGLLLTVPLVWLASAFGQTLRRPT